MAEQAANELKSEMRERCSARPPTVPAFSVSPPAAGPSTRKTACCNCRPECVSRRSMLRRSILGSAAILLSSLGMEGKSRAEEPGESNEEVCKNCYGSGKISCDLCSGTGFWRALSGSDPKQRYKGVVCPECEGVGTLMCTVCLGTGEGKVRGLLRRRRVEPGPGRVLQTN